MAHLKMIVEVPNLTMVLRLQKTQFYGQQVSL